MKDNNLSKILDGVEKLLDRPEQVHRWTEFKSNVSGSLDDALECALRGEFDRACAIAIDVDSPIAGVFSVKMGALTHAMTKSVAPPLAELIDRAAKLPEDYQFSDLARTLVGYVSGAKIPADYSRAFREAISRFEFKSDSEHLMLGFLFLDARVVNYPEFAENLVKLYEEKSQIVCSFIEAMDERGKLFENQLYLR